MKGSRGSEAAFGHVVLEEDQAKAGSHREEPVNTSRTQGDRVTRALDSLGTALWWSELY